MIGYNIIDQAIHSSALMKHFFSPTGFDTQMSNALALAHPGPFCFSFD